VLRLRLRPNDEARSGSVTLVKTLFVLPFMIITTSVGELHHFYAAPAPIKNLDPDPEALAPTLLYS
jgi:hypothetical protein